jgi:hypothetical protein
MLVPPLLRGQKQCQKKHQHQQKACRELRQQLQGQGSVSRISPFQKRPTTSRSGWAAEDMGQSFKERRCRSTTSTSCS